VTRYGLTEGLALNYYEEVVCSDPDAMVCSTEQMVVPIARPANCSTDTCTARNATHSGTGLCAQPAEGVLSCPDKPEMCYFTPGPRTCTAQGAGSNQTACTEALGRSADGSACRATAQCTYSHQGSCAVADQAACTAALQADTNGTRCRALKCAYFDGAVAGSDGLRAQNGAPSACDETSSMVLSRFWSTIEYQNWGQATCYVSVLWLLVLMLSPPPASPATLNRAGCCIGCRHSGRRWHSLRSSRSLPRRLPVGVPLPLAARQ
jgi:hypothetical protein